MHGAVGKITLPRQKIQENTIAFTLTLTPTPTLTLTLTLTLISYVTRRKAGGRQSVADAAKTIKSAGTFPSYHP